MSDSQFAQWLEAARKRCDDALDRHLPATDTQPQRLHEAMRYAVLEGGKRVRPLLAFGAGEVAHAAPERLETVAAAVELIHAYSLVHDDLPCMDDDDMRRGRPTVHKAYDEATAVLAGDALQAMAFEILAHPDTAATVRAMQRWQRRGKPLGERRTHGQHDPLAPQRPGRQRVGLDGQAPCRCSRRLSHGIPIKAARPHAATSVRRQPVQLKPDGEVQHASFVDGTRRGGR